MGLFLLAVSALCFVAAALCDDTHWVCVFGFLIVIMLLI